MGKLIKYIGIILLCTSFMALENASVFQQQGFTSYQEGYNSALDFTCETQCVVILGALGSIDCLDVNKIYLLK